MLCLRIRVAIVVSSACLLQSLLLPGEAFSAAADVPSIDEAVRIADWFYLGPFSVGAREGIIGVVDDPAKLAPHDERRFPSTLAQSGFVKWKKVSPDSTGWTKIEFENVLWDTLMDIYGYAGIVNGAYAYAEFVIRAERRALVVAERVGSFYLNGIEHPGDPYGHGFMQIPVLLRQGRNRVLLKLTGYADHRFRFEIDPAPAPVIALGDYTLPDIIEGDSGDLWIGVALLNTTPTRIDGLSIEFGGGRFVSRREATVSNIAPLCVKKVPLRIHIETLPDSARECLVPVRVTHKGISFKDTFALRVRGSGQSFKRTFISSIDSSCQYYAVLPPLGYDPQSEYGLIFTLHGANVKAERQADAYKPKSWAFVVAPTNRRPYGFDWQDWGRLDALEVLEIVKNTFPVDGDRVYLTGHSMGGHGVWHVGLAHPDLFAAMAPGAGWTCFELYVPWFLQKAYVFGGPARRGVRETALRQDWPHLFIENARNLPIFVLQGGSDDNVPPYHARLFVRRLEELGYDYQYKEDPGRGHWWSIDSLDVSCVDDPDLIGFFPKTARDRFPRHIVFKTVNVAHSNRAYWLKVSEQERPYQESRIDARLEGETVSISTDNVKAFEITLARQLIPGGRVSVLVDGKRWTFSLGDRRTITFSKRGGEFRSGDTSAAGLTKSPDLHGPIKQATFSPFVLVYGTKGDPLTTAILLDQARLEAFGWWRRANGFVEVLPDTEVTPRIIDHYNLILFGGPRENSIAKRINRSLPIKLVDGSLFLGGNKIEGNGIAANFVYPNPLNTDRLAVIYEGSDTEGLRLSTFFRAVYPGSGLPDLIVFDGSVKRCGWGGVIAAGFFDSKWQLDPSLMYYESE
jgi:pimeloyl-ACP methyl ester carboxylesterase